jgi:hypothetical protein
MRWPPNYGNTLKFRMSPPARALDRNAHCLHGICTANGKKREAMLQRYSFIDERYVPLLGMKLVAGHNFSPDNAE